MSDAAIPFGLDAGADAVSLRLGDALFGRRGQPKSPNEALQPQSAPPPPPPPPPKRRRRSPFLSAASGILSFLVIVAVAAALFDAAMQKSLRSPGPLAGDKIVVIPAGSPPGDIADQLEGDGVINSKLMFSFAALRQGVRSSLKAGEYSFKQQASLQDVLDKLVSGKAIFHTITIPEGLTSEQIVNRVKENDILTGEVRDIPKEGTLLPETYSFGRGMTRDALLLKMAKDQKVMLDEVWKKRAADIPVKSPWELVTLASIVEKETGKADERPHVASVFANRLVKRMRLQSDPTIIYGLVGGKGTLGRGILKKEVETPTPYNTYTIDGLPPGPIANPGKAALEAVANPAKTKDLFFVADGTGGHVFAETLDQHNRNVVRWREIEKDAKERYQPTDAAPVPTAAPAPAPGTKGALEPEGGAAFATLAPAAGEGNAEALQTLRNLLAARAGKASAAVAKISEGRSAQARQLAGKSLAPGASVKTAAAAGGFDAGPSVADIAAKMPGLNAFAPDAAEDVTSSISGPEPSMQSYPVSAVRRADQLARAAQYGVAQYGEVSAAPAAPQSEPLTTAEAMAALAIKLRRKALDASEGTALDPLRNKNFDLSTAKSVPALK